eukprot:7653865-Pyramimonas_sp.AAC.1
MGSILPWSWCFSAVPLSSGGLFCRAPGHFLPCGFARGASSAVLLVSSGLLCRAPGLFCRTPWLLGPFL